MASKETRYRTEAQGWTVGRGEVAPTHHGCGAIRGFHEIKFSEGMWFPAVTAPPAPCLLCDNKLRNRHLDTSPQLLERPRLAEERAAMAMRGVGKQTRATYKAGEIAQKCSNRSPKTWYMNSRGDFAWANIRTRAFTHALHVAVEVAR